MAKQKTSRALKREEKKRRKAMGIGKPSGESKYGKKNRKNEIARGYSTRKTSPFYLSPEQVRAIRATQKAQDKHAEPIATEQIEVA